MQSAASRPKQIRWVVTLNGVVVYETDCNTVTLE
jgi:hypothetical protein